MSAPDHKCSMASPPFVQEVVTLTLLNHHLITCIVRSALGRPEPGLVCFCYVRVSVRPTFLSFFLRYLQRVRAVYRRAGKPGKCLNRLHYYYVITNVDFFRGKCFINPAPEYCLDFTFREFVHWHLAQVNDSHPRARERTSSARPRKPRLCSANTVRIVNACIEIYFLW